MNAAVFDNEIEHLEELAQMVTLPLLIDYVLLLEQSKGAHSTN